MAEATSTPRITAQYLDNYVGRNVMLIGKVLQLRGDSAVLDADGNVTAILNRDVHLTNGNGAQIIGKVNPDLSIKVLTSRDLGADVDYQLAAAVPSGRVYGRNQVTNPAPSHHAHAHTPPRAPVTRPATTTTLATTTTANPSQLQRQQQQQQQTPPTTQRRPPRYIPPTPTPPSPDLTRHRSTTPISLTHPPSPQTQKRYSSTFQAFQPQQPQKYDPDHGQSPNANQNKKTSIPYRPSRTAALPPTPPSPDKVSRSTFAPSTSNSTSISKQPQIKASSESSSRTVKAREGREAEESRPRRQKLRPKESEVVEVKQVADDDSELLGAILDGIGRMAVGTVAMRMDDAGRWRIRRDPGEESD
ncbi:replication factor A protein 3-domain-containing protein [Colletotrichum godetiae]|uniref:Replication factor A protein 3-domain-containing protein n=1 Tax=Colletotrichum godetiae TaxID=1209918 RepID=A0AAJ0ATS5_9PEZI|nr:replication factor A protein 3-domain-containing protein [Colletotrichum godetiae]KAK1688009.1 replication factor A protein 3-domain-containing protein [Colletotrichum godetiae]